MWVWIPAWPVTALVSLSKTLNHNCFVLQMGRKAVGPVCCVMHVKEPRPLIVKEKGLAPVFLDSRLEHPAGWICACYKSSVLLLLLLNEQVVDKGIKQKSTKELTHSLTAVPFVQGHRTVSPRTCVYTRHPAQCHAAPGQTCKKTECVLRRSPIHGWKKNCGFIRHPMRTG